MVDFDRRKWLVDIYKDNHPYIVIMKCSQVGISEWLIVELFCEAWQGRAVIYIFPTNEFRNEWLPERIGGAIQYTPEYQDGARRSRKGTDNKSTITLWNVTNYFLGSNSDKKLFGKAASTIFIDERKLCVEDNLRFADDRTQAEENAKMRIIGNPGLPNSDMDAEFRKTDMREWMIKCPHCNEWQSLNFFVNVMRLHDSGNYYVPITDVSTLSDNQDIPVLCKKCWKPVDRLSDGEWVATCPDRKDRRGYHVNKVFADARYMPVIRALVAQHDEAIGDGKKMERFYNNLLGEPYSAKGSYIDEAMMSECAELGYYAPSRCANSIGGVDVGAKLHTQFIAPEKGKYRLVYAGSVYNFSDLHDKVVEYGATTGCIDAAPETRAAREFCRAHPGWYMTRYNSAAVTLKEMIIDDEQQTITVGRTESLDKSYRRYYLKQMVLPQNYRQLDGGDFVAQTIASVRRDEKKPNGETVGVWDEGGKPDHHRHAGNYAMIACSAFAGDMRAVYL